MVRTTHTPEALNVIFGGERTPSHPALAESSCRKRAVQSQEDFTAWDTHGTINVVAVLLENTGGCCYCFVPSTMSANIRQPMSMCMLPELRGHSRVWTVGAAR